MGRTHLGNYEKGLSLKVKKAVTFNIITEVMSKKTLVKMDPLRGTIITPDFYYISIFPYNMV
jgi:hypothetical protein